MKKLIIFLIVVFCGFCSCKKVKPQTTSENEENKIAIVNNDTIIKEPSIIIVFPNELEVEQLKGKHGENDFYILADDASYYMAEIKEKIKNRNVIFSSKNSYFFNKQKIKITTKDSNSPWFIIDYTNENPRTYSLVDYYSKINKNENNTDTKTLSVVENDNQISFDEISKSKTYKIYNIDLNNDNIKDKIASNENGSDLLFFIKKNNTYINVYKGDNYTQDGIYFIDEIKAYNKGNYVCCIKTFFNGSGGQNINYFIEYINKEWKLNKTISYNLSRESNTICINNLIDQEKCLILKEGESTKLLNNFKSFLKENKSTSNISEELIYTLLFNFKLNEKTIINYNDIAYYLEQSKAYKEAIYLLEKIIKKSPRRTVAYINLGDAYWGINNNEKAKSAYLHYVELMKTSGKESKIPNRVKERVSYEK